MSDLYQSIANSNLGRKVLSAINLPVPVDLDRWHGQSSFIQGNVLIGAAPGSNVVDTISKTLADSSANVFFPQGSEDREGIEKAAEKAELKIQGIDTEAEANNYRYKALVFDATAIEDATQLKTMYNFFHPVIRKLDSSARVVVIGRPPETAETPAKAAAMRALEGFIRSVAKEVGKKGCTAQTILVSKGAENQLASPLRFVLSPKSAYVSAQVIRVGRAKVAKEFDWKQPLAGKVALVTGASRGIGASIAETLARDGAKVLGLDIAPAEQDLNQIMNRLGGQALVCDITAEDAPKQIADVIEKDFKGIDLIVHNAGITRDKTLGGMPPHFWDQVIDINLAAEERINDELLERKLINSGGRIVCVSSMSGIAGNFGQTNYATSKAGVIGYVQAMSSVLAKDDITINAVAPGFIETQMTAAMPFAIREVGRRLNSLSQGGQPVDVAETIAFFGNPASAGVNGNIVRVCGQSMIGA